MRQSGILLALIATALCAQDGQKGSRPEWPCVAGRAVDPSYIETSESSGGQLFLFQKNEVGHASLFMSASFTHPATVLRAVGSLSGSRDFEFPVDSRMESMLVMASLQCRSAIQVSRPGGAEVTVANSARNVDLQAGRIVQVDSPESGKWKVRLTGTGLFVLSVVAKTDLKLAGVSFFAAGEDGARLIQPVLGVRQNLEAHVGGEVSNLKFHAIGPTGELMSDLDATAANANGTYRFEMTPPAERFRIVVTGTDAMACPFQRTYPNLFRAEPPK
jgi:hypothetical protein